MKLRYLAFLPLLPFAALAADKFTVTVTNDLSIARPAEVISVPWTDVTKNISGVQLQHLQVTDSAGHVLPYQVTNTKPLDANGSYGELLFQHDFAAGEKSATFTIEKIEQVAPPFPSKVFARYIPERLDDFAWENDKIAHRTYGPALAEPAPAGSGKEVLVTSGLDVWCKRVDYLVVDRWYNKGHNHYHHDEGEGMDMYQVGTSRGCGGTGVWDGHELHVARNYKTWKVLANGPIRSIFELSYETWTANGAIVWETKRFTVDAGHNLDQIESTFVASVGPKQFTIGIGVNKNSADKGQEVKADVAKNQEQGWFVQWEQEKSNGSLGEAVIVPGAELQGFAEDSVNHLVLAKVTSGQPLRYYVGAGWSKSGQFSSQDDWTNYVTGEAARAKSPVKVSISQ
jgi:hypothetical protein